MAMTAGCCQPTLALGRTSHLQIPATGMAGSDVLEYTSFHAVFQPTAGGMCGCCEFRQQIRGTIRIGGIAISHDLGNGVMLDPVTWNEDGSVSTSGYVYRYGHRRHQNRKKVDTYGNPDRGTGCEYVGVDVPWVERIVAGTTYDIALEFRCYVLCSCSGSPQELSADTWTMTCNGIA